MTFKIPVLLFSIAVNGGLIAHLWNRARSDVPGSSLVTSVGTVLPAPKTTLISLTPEAWSKFREGTDAQLIARLRAEGVPKSMQAVIAKYVIEEGQAERLKTILAKRRPIEYWKRSFYGRADFNDHGQQEFDELNREKQRQLRTLLGADAPTSLTPQMVSKVFGHFTAERAQEIADARQSFVTVERDYRDQTHGVLFPEDRAKLQEMAEAQDSKLKALLTPVEYADYQMHGSETAIKLRTRQYPFEASDDEFAKLFSIQTAFDAKYGGSDPTREQQVQKLSAQTDLDKQTLDALGPDRFAEFQKKTSSLYQQTYQFLSYSVVDTELTDSLIALRQSTDSAVNATKADQSLTAEQNAARLADLARSTDEKLDTLLGKTIADKYRSQNASWVKSLRLVPKSGVKP